MQDDELREVFQSGRAADRDHAPAFEAVWGAAKREQRRRRFAAIGVAAAAVVVLAAAWMIPTDPVSPPTSPAHVAQTSPVPDLPLVEPAEDSQQLELAAWEPATFDSPTDFLLADDGALAGGLPSSILDDPILDLDDLMMEL